MKEETKCCEKCNLDDRLVHIPGRNLPIVLPCTHFCHSQSIEGEESNSLRTRSWDKAFDKLLDGMAPKVSNFGGFSDEVAKNALQDILSKWWKEADTFYRNPLKKFIQSVEDAAYERGEEEAKFAIIPRMVAYKEGKDRTLNILKEKIGQAKEKSYEFGCGDECIDKAFDICLSLLSDEE